MSEHFTDSFESAEPLYDQAIGEALSGYAPDQASWLHARDVFLSEIDSGVGVDAALRDALADVSIGAESTPEVAATRFWNRVEGEEGPHALYGNAINSALDGYARSGELWLRARDSFFDSIRSGEVPNSALYIALGVAADGAESDPEVAATRFWQSAQALEAEADVVLTTDDLPVEDLSWPAITETLGSETSRITYDEAEKIFEDVEIRGDAALGKLTPELLRDAGLMPRHRLEADNRTFWFSPGYHISHNRVAVVGYVRDDDGSVVARSYYLSNSQGVWRYLPQYRMRGGVVDWYSKGFGEESITLPAVLRESLTRSLNDDGHALRLADSRVAQRIFLGTARRVGSDGTVYHERVSKYPARLEGMSGWRGRELPPPSSIRVTREQSPNFQDTPLRWSQDTSIYGRLTYQAFHSNDGRILYVFCHDRKGRAWVSSIENDSPLESTGLHEQWMSGGALTTPAYEYASQAGMYANYGDTRGNYVDMFTYYLSNIRMIRDYIRQRNVRVI